MTPAILNLGSARMAAIDITITPGVGTWSASSSSTAVSLASDGLLAVDAPVSEPGCNVQPRPVTETVTITWHAIHIGDGVHSAGRTETSGTLHLIVTWTIAQNRGESVADGQGGQYWTGCSTISAPRSNEIVLTR
jgi:hypothetical protein